MSEAQLIQFLREEFRSLTEHVRNLSTAVAKLEGNLAQQGNLSEELDNVRRRTEELGLAIASQVVTLETIAHSNVRLEAMEKKVEGLMLSRATLAGYAAAAAGAGSVIAKLLM